MVVLGITVELYLDFPLAGVDFPATERGLICSSESCVLKALVDVEVVVAVVLVEVVEVIMTVVQTVVVVVVVVGVEGQARVRGVEMRRGLPIAEAAVKSPCARLLGSTKHCWGLHSGCNKILYSQIFNYNLKDIKILKNSLLVTTIIVHHISSYSTNY